MTAPVCKPPEWLTAQILRDLLSYDPTTGLFRWRNAAGRYGRIPAGSVAGNISKVHGYRLIGLGGSGKTVRATHLAWLYMTGEWPELQVDHKNGVESDDWWDNLRLATQSQNKANSSRYKNNTSGVTGVIYENGPGRKHWRAILRADGKSVNIGRFLTKEEAIEARQKAEEQYHGEFVRKNRA